MTSIYIYAKLERSMAQPPSDLERGSSSELKPDAGSLTLQAELIAIRDAQTVPPVEITTEAPTVRKYDSLTRPLPVDEPLLLQQLGLKGKEELDMARGHTELARDKARVMIHMPEVRIESFLNDGKYVSSTESGRGTSAGREANEVNFGLRTADEPPIVYGYLGTEDDSTTEHLDVQSYGGANLVLKPKVFDRTVFSNRDSQMQGRNVTLYNQEDAMLSEEARKISISQGRPKQPGVYTEALIHDGMTLEYIEAISVPLSKGLEQNIGAESRSQSATKMAELLRQRLPETRKTLQIDASSDMTDITDLIQTALHNPDITFEFVVRTSDSPPSIERAIADQSTHPDISQQHVANSERTYKKLAARKTEVDTGLLLRFARQAGLEGLPANVKTSLTYNDQRFGGHHTDTHK